MYSPLIAGDKNSFFNSDEPNRSMAGVAISVCTPIAVITPRSQAWPKASAKANP